MENMYKEDDHEKESNEEDSLPLTLEYARALLFPDDDVEVTTMVPGKTIYDNGFFEDIDELEAKWLPKCAEKRPATNQNSTQEKKKKKKQKVNYHWTIVEHNLFLEGLEKCGKGNWKDISREFVRSRSLTQVATHAQKYFKKQDKKSENKGKQSKRRCSIMDITTVDKKQETSSFDKNKPLQLIESHTHIPSQQQETTINATNTLLEQDKPLLFNDSSTMPLQEYYEPATIDDTISFDDLDKADQYFLNDDPLLNLMLLEAYPNNLQSPADSTVPLDPLESLEMLFP